MQIHSEVYQSKLPVETEQETLVIKFRTGNTLIVDQESGELRLISKQQMLQLVVSIKEEGLSVDINAAHLNINAENEINLTSKKISIHGSEQVNVFTKGNLVMEAEKDSLLQVSGTNKSVAKIQKITASLGNVELKANDDVRLDGERVKLNCD